MRGARNSYDIVRYSFSLAHYFTGGEAKETGQAAEKRPITPLPTATRPGSGGIK